MKKVMNMAVVSTMLVGQMYATNAMADLTSRTEKISQSIMSKVKSSTHKIGSSLTLDLDLGELSLATSLKYKYVLDPDQGKYLREDRWTDLVRGRLGEDDLSPVERSLSRYMTYGRFFDNWDEARGEFLFSPLELKDLNSETISSKMRQGDMFSVTIEKATLLGIRGGATNGSVSAGGFMGKVFNGKITTKILKRADGKVEVTFANADENAIHLAADVKVEIISGILKLRLLDIDKDFHLRGSADLASYSYDLSNPKAAEALNAILRAFDEPTILTDQNVLREGVRLTPKLKKGIVDIASSEIASKDANSGIVKLQKVYNNIVDGNRSRFKFKLLPQYLQSTQENKEVLNLTDITLSGSYIKPGQYIVGYRTNSDSQKSFGIKNALHSLTSIAYNPDPILNNAEQAKGYRGIKDLVGISYHTDSLSRSNPKEMYTYAKLCNAGLVECAGPIQLSVISPESEKLHKEEMTINSNYFFSRGLFEKIKERLQWSRSSKNQQSDAIRAAIAPIINEIVLEKPDLETSNSAVKRQLGGPRQMTDRMTAFFQEILENDCYSNLIGLNAQNQKNIFKRLFSEKCGTNLYDISDEVVRLNMPSLLIALYNPEILPSLDNPTARVSAQVKKELDQYFSVTMNTSYRTAGQEVIKQINGANFGMSVSDTRLTAGQVVEFTSLVKTWQEQKSNSLTLSDRLKMIREKK